MFGIRTLVDIGFFLSIIGFVVYSFVNEAIRQEAVSLPSQSENRPERASEETFDVTVTSQNQDRTRDTPSLKLPTLVVDGTGRDVRTLALDGDPVVASKLPEKVRKRGIKRLRLEGNPDVAHQIMMDVKHLCEEGGVTSFADVRFRRVRRSEPAVGGVNGGGPGAPAREARTRLSKKG